MLEDLSGGTCEAYMTVAQLMAVCEHRGFRPPKRDKASLAAFVAPRLLSSAGVERAMAKLKVPWLSTMHALALAPDDVGVSMRVVRRVAQLEGREYRDAFRALGDELLARGVVLVRDEDEPGAESRFASLYLILPEAHRRFLPPFPVPSAPLPAPPPSGAASKRMEYCRRALRAAVDRHRGGGGSAGTASGLLARCAARVTIEGERLKVGGSEISAVAALVDSNRAQWMRDETDANTSRYFYLSAPPWTWREAAAYVWHHLPSGHGASCKALAESLGLLAVEVDVAKLEAFASEGEEAGILMSAEVAGERLYAAAPEGDVGDETLVSRPCAGGIAVDLSCTGMAPLLELVALCRVRAEKQGQTLVLVPDLVRIGRRWGEESVQLMLGAVSRNSPAFGAAVVKVRQSYGKLLVHAGLVVMRVADIGLRALLQHQLEPHIRELGDDYLAVPRGFLRDVEVIARNAGFVPRRLP
ncbi:MAG: hypothetical protein HYV63_03745 [Candidatus Schekmanbacteria bacterium]|nr:hypothetical protein [Candidatus Schekmanbacteria bacterium]